MIQTSTLPRFVDRKAGDLINRFDGPKIIVGVMDRRPHPKGITMGGSPADIVTYVVKDAPKTF